MKKKVAFVFPGQGSQYLGMAKDFISSDQESLALFDTAEAILERKIKDLTINGPEDELQRTINSQVAIFLTNRICELALRAQGVAADLVAGHSLGEYNALLSAGVLTFESALLLLKERSSLMDKAATENPGKMAAVIGIAGDRIEAILSNLSKEGVIAIANYNSPGQTIISGEAAILELAINELKAAGAKRVIELAVSGAFHSPLMSKASLKFSQILEGTEFKEASIPVISNLTGRASTDPKTLKEALSGQMESSVQWVKSVLEMDRSGASVFIELGPKRVLSGLISKILPDAKCLNVEDPMSLNATLSSIKEV